MTTTTTSFVKSAVTARTPRSFAFGPFMLLPERQLLLRGEKAVRIGGRALDLLTALVERPGDVVTKSELIAQVWPDTTVDESNLKVNMATLRRVIEEGPDTPQYIATVVGRGYRFIAPVEVTGPLDPPIEAEATGRAIVEGEPGPGEPRLLEEEGDEGDRRGAPVTLRRGLEGDGTASMWPWVTVGAVLDALGAASRDEWVGGELGRLVGPRGRLRVRAALPDSGAQFQRFRGGSRARQPRIRAAVGDDRRR